MGAWSLKKSAAKSAPQSDDLAFQVCQPEAQVSQGDGAPNGHEVPVIGAGLHGAHAALQRYLGQDVVPQIAQVEEFGCFGTKNPK